MQAIQQQNTYSKIILEGAYRPRDFFEAKQHYYEDEFSIEIEDGKILVTLCRTELFPDEGLIFARVKKMFELQKFELEKPYKLDDLRVITFNVDGAKTIYCSIGEGLICVDALALDWIIKDKDGNVTCDSQEEQLNAIERRRKQSSNEFLNLMIECFNKAQDEPVNMMFYTYDISEALNTRFGGELEVREALKIDGKKWSNFRKITCGEPIQESRHRGKFLEKELRPATHDEKQYVMSFAKGLINNYIEYLEKNKGI